MYPNKKKINVKTHIADSDVPVTKQICHKAAGFQSDLQNDIAKIWGGKLSKSCNCVSYNCLPRNPEIPHKNL